MQNVVKFQGRIVSGIHKHSELTIPGRSMLENAPEDWPEVFFPGSLNILITQWPDLFTKPRQKTLATLDKGIIKPCLVIPREKIGNNYLRKKIWRPMRGTGQVWRCSINYSEQELKCWFFRRIGSRMLDTLEIIAPINIRNTLDIPKDQEPEVTLNLYP